MLLTTIPASRGNGFRKQYQSTRWVFSEGANSLNPVSHCDIAWAGALATHAHTERKSYAGGLAG